MREVVASTRRRITLLVLLAIFVISGVMYFGLQYANITQINTPISTAELHEHVKDNPSLHQYLESQKEYEAHFITLANKIRSEDARRISEVVAIFGIVSVVCGSAIALLVVRALMKQISEAYLSQERFLQDAAHELCNPLAALTVALQQYERSKNPAKLIDTVRRQSRRLIGITEDLLFLERTSRGEAEPQNLKNLLEDIIEEIQPLASKSNITLIAESEDVHKTIVTADYVRMVKNILDNAVKYSPVGSTVRVSQSLEKSTILIRITDNGIGIPKDQLGQIGKRFFRANNVGEIDGTGLGIAIVQKLVNLYSGTLRIESNKHGTIVTIKLPK